MNDPIGFGEAPLTAATVAGAFDLAVERVGQCVVPDKVGHGRGIVTYGGGLRYFVNAWVCIRVLRKLGCELPIELWHLGESELDEPMRALVGELDVTPRNALEVRERHPCRILNGWELKPFGIIHSDFEEVISLDADVVCAKNPAYLFETPQYREHGAIFWPDRWRIGPQRSIWQYCGVDYRDHAEFESGQIVIDKRRFWRVLQLTKWMNDHSDFFYRHIYGDKDTFYFAIRRLGRQYAMPSKPLQESDGTFFQFDFDGDLVFQHRTQSKWTLRPGNRRVAGFRHEDWCFAALEELRRKWRGRLCAMSAPTSRGIGRRLLAGRWTYRLSNGECRPMVFRANGEIGTGRDRHERYWGINRNDELEIYCANGRKTLGLRYLAPRFQGRWVVEPFHESCLTRHPTRRLVDRLSRLLRPGG